MNLQVDESNDVLCELCHKKEDEVAFIFQGVKVRSCLSCYAEELLKDMNN